MRILVLNELHNYEVYYIQNLFFDNNVYDSNKNVISGLTFYDGEDYYAIPNVSESEVNEVCKYILVNGYCDLTNYGPYEAL